MSTLEIVALRKPVRGGIGSTQLRSADKYRSTAINNAPRAAAQLAPTGMSTEPTTIAHPLKARTTCKVATIANTVAASAE